MRRPGLKRALTGLRGTRWSSAAVLLSLALGIGVNTATFSFVDALLLKPFPYSDSDRVVFIWGSQTTSTRRGLKPAFIEEVRSRSREVVAIAAMEPTSFRFSSGSGEEESLTGRRVTPAVFAVLGVQPLMGRTFEEASEADKAGAAVVSYAYWTSRLARRADVLGTVVDVEGERREIIGVMPEKFFFPDYDVDVWIPIGVSRVDLHAVARLAPGSSAARAQREIKQIAAGTAGHVAPPDVGVFQVATAALGDHANAAVILYIATCVLLLGACANASNWFLANTLRRTSELAIHVCLGAKRRHMILVAVKEPILLATLAAAVGVALARVTLPVLRRVASDAVPQYAEASVDLGALSYAVLATLITAITCSVLPLVMIRHLDPMVALRRGSRWLPRSRFDVRAGLVTLQMIVAMILLIGSGVLIMTFVRLTAVEWGFDPAGVVVAEVSVPREMLVAPASRSEFTTAVLNRLSTTQGVRDAASGFNVPTEQTHYPVLVRVDSKPISATVFYVSRTYFSTLRIPIRGDTWVAAGPGTVVVGEDFAARLWPNENAIGKTFELLKPQRGGRTEVRLEGSDVRIPMVAERLQVAGVVAVVRMLGVSDSAGPAIYADMAASDRRTHTSQYFVVRGTGDAPIGTRLREHIHATHPGARVVRLFSMESAIRRSIESRGSTALIALVSGVLSALALALAATGVYSMVSLAIAQQWMELAVRRALGAGSAALAWTVLRGTVRPALIGIGLGFIGSLGTAILIRHLLFETHAADPRISAGAIGVLIVCMLVPTISSVRRVVRANPWSALRQE